MQPGLKAKGRGLQEFARGKSDSNANYNAPSDKPYQPDPGRRSATPSADSYQPSRQEIAEFARLPIPGAAPKTVGSPRASAPLRSIHRVDSPVQHGYGSPKRQSRGKQIQTAADHHGIFSGSQLGENFMNSGLSTPTNDPEALAVVQAPEIKVEERVERNQVQRMVPRHVPPSDFEKHQFSIEVDGRLSVVPGLNRHNPSHMNDGFYNSKGYHNHVRYQPKPIKQANPTYSHQAPTVQAQARLPMRGVRVSRGQHSLPNALPIQEEVPPQGRFTEVEEESWEEQASEKANESILVHDSDNEFDAFRRFGGRPASPKTKKHNGAPMKPAREGTHKSSKVTHDLQQKSKKRRRQSLDYDDKVLSSMTYQDLQGEPFDVVPQLPGMLNGHDSAASKLMTRLEQFQQQGEREQHQFFSHMSIEEWENAGDWFVDHFTDIMNRLRQARRDKRKMVAAFEMEASQREEAIRLRTDAIDKKLIKMKQDGQRVVGDKHL